MPLFMDFHKMENVSIEAVKNAHLMDVAIQEKYGVKYHQYWVNEAAGTIFCLTEGPDKESCEAVHKDSHGNSACAITQVDGGFYNTLMGNGLMVDQEGLVHPEQGIIDQGYRTLLAVSLIPVNKNKDASAQNQSSTKQEKLLQFIYESIQLNKGRELKDDTGDDIIAVFNSSIHAIDCAYAIKEKVREYNNNDTTSFVFRAGISASQPVTVTGDFFKGAIRQAIHLCSLAKEGSVLVSELAKKLSKSNAKFQDNTFKGLNEEEETFVNQLFSITANNLSDCGFGVDKLSTQVCISRPQLYRKITALSGRSPNELIQDLRMQKALTLLKRKTGNITAIAFEVGFNSPSYFTKCFTQKFGCTPSAFTKQASGTA